VEIFDKVVDGAGTVLEGVGVAVLVVGTAVVLVRYAIERVTPDGYASLRRRLGQVILVGLELLVAADIVHTAAVEPSFTSVGILASIVLIRTFLSMAIGVEINGTWPWRRAHAEDGS
jgi:uncharacterized membrane protein